MFYQPHLAPWGQNGNKTAESTILHNLFMKLMIIMQPVSGFLFSPWKEYTSRVNVGINVTK